MTIDQVINLLAAVTLFEMMVAIGLGVTFGEVVGVARDWRLMVRAAGANYLGVPAAAVGLLLLFEAQPLVAAGFLIAAVCPGAPYGPPFTSLARGNVVVAVGLMVLLAGSSALAAPLLLQVLLPVVAENEPLQVDAVKMVTTLLFSQLLPLCLGLALRQWRPAWADRLKKPANVLSMLLNLSLLGTILVVQFDMLTAIPWRAFGGMFLLLLATLTIGWLLGGPGAESRKTLAIATAVRNAGVSLVIVSSSFAGTPAVTATTAYALFQTLVMAALAVAWGRFQASTSASADRGNPWETTASPNSNAMTQRAS
jgi:BASS family bile acid:Na+ symporter